MLAMTMRILADFSQSSCAVHQLVSMGRDYLGEEYGMDSFIKPKNCSTLLLNIQAKFGHVSLVKDQTGLRLNFFTYKHQQSNCDFSNRRCDNHVGFNNLKIKPTIKFKNTSVCLWTFHFICSLWNTGLQNVYKKCMKINKFLYFCISTFLNTSKYKAKMKSRAFSHGF